MRGDAGRSREGGCAQAEASFVVPREPSEEEEVEGGGEGGAEQEGARAVDLVLVVAHAGEVGGPVGGVPEEEEGEIGGD